MNNAFNVTLGLLNSSTYGNNQKIEYKYDVEGRLIEELTDGISHFTYANDAKGNKAQVGDRKTGLFAKSVYVIGGKITNVYDTLSWDSYFNYDNVGNIIRE